MLVFDKVLSLGIIYQFSSVVDFSSVLIPEVNRFYWTQVPAEELVRMVMERVEHATPLLEISALALELNSLILALLRVEFM